MRTLLAPRCSPLIMLSFFALLSTAAAQAPLPTAGAPDDSVMEIWAGMHAAGMIDDAQFAQVKGQGTLPPDTTVKKSPLPAEKQKVWMEMEQKGLVTADELVHMLFEGKTPNLSADEVNAFEELAPVYEPDSRKRISPEIRRKHQRVELVRLSHRYRAEWTRKRTEAEVKARQLGFPIKIEYSHGGGMELQAFEGNKPWYHTTLNGNAADTIATDEVYLSATNGFDLSGSTVHIGMWDEGKVKNTHQEFSTNRVIQQDSASTLSYHSTGVAGTLAAAGVAPSARGMAPAANIDAYDWNANLSEIAQATWSNDLRISNHSYGNSEGWHDNLFYGWIWYGDIAVSTNEDFGFGLYNERAQSLDNLAYQSSCHLLVWAAGNDRNDEPPSQPINHITWNNGVQITTNMFHPRDGGANGFDTLLDYQVAKNIVTVGAVADLVGGYAGTQSVVMTAFSSFGPTDDGRVKPDVVANGLGVYTPGVLFSYNTLDGTSFSSPSVAGSLGLLLELQQQLHGTNSPLLASTLKALTIHTADEAGGTPGPDYSFGWGLMNTFKAAQVMTNDAAWDSRPHIKEIALLNGDYVDTLVSSEGVEPLRITICWTDPPGLLQPNVLDPTNAVLVNDLDLRVIDPNGITNFPWVLTPTNPASPATTGDNVRDNVEQVFIASPTNGLYEILVTHKGSVSNGVQDVSMIITGNTPTNAPELYVSEISLVDTSIYRRVQWPAVVGSLYRVVTKTNLVEDATWSDASGTLSGSKDSMLWTDEAYTGALDEVRFYRVEQNE